MYHAIRAIGRAAWYTSAVPYRTDRPRSGNSAKALLLTMLGEFTLPMDGAVWTSTIIDGLGLVGVGESNARQAAARLSDQGIVESRRMGRAAEWRLTERGRQLLEDGTERIYRFATRPDGWDRRWLVVLAPVPEDARAKRHQLRSRLGFAGFGFLGPTVAVSPHVEREDAANSVLRDLELDDTAVVLRAETGSFVPDDEIIRRAWDLDGLDCAYRSFIDDVEAVEVGGAADSFAAVVTLVHRWRRFPFDDPEIPGELLPDDWPGPRAKSLFDDRRVAWSDDARRWYARAEGRT